MSDSPSILAKARSTFAKRGGMLRTSNAIRLGIHPRTLYALRDSGEIEPVSRGLYRLASAPPLTAPDFIAIARRRVPHLRASLDFHALVFALPKVCRSSQADAS
jgi:hypothetical protein